MTPSPPLAWPIARSLPFARQTFCSTRWRRIVATLLFSCLSLTPSLHAQRKDSASSGETLSSPSTSRPQTSSAASGTTPRADSATVNPANGKPVESKPASTVPLQPPPPGFDITARSREVLDQLSAVVRFFRTHLTPIQTIGEPSDALYRDQALSSNTQVATLAFQSAKAEAVLFTAYQRITGNPGVPQVEGEAQKLQGFRTDIAQRLVDLKAQDILLNNRIARAKPRDRPVLQQQQQQIEGVIELDNAMGDALNKTISLTDTQGKTGLGGDVERLERSAPELVAGAKPTVPAPLASLGAARSSGVTSQASALFRLLTTQHSIDQWIDDNDALHTQALALRTPLANVVRNLIQSSETLSQQAQAGIASSAQPNSPGTPANPSASGTAPPPAPAETAASVRRRFDSATATFNIVSAAMVPLSQEIITLEQSRANLLAWRAAVTVEYNQVLRDLLWRVAIIAAALAILFLLGELWRRATTRYVHDLRRRRQLLVMRRVVVGFLSGLVLIFGFVTQFNSLATFAGFITAGLAVGLQTILLSVAAYFFIVGRYGVRVGDRITVAGVTGDVIDVGLVRFYVMELAGSGTELHTTGRVAVFSNAILFQAGTPLYKQMPGTEYAWHELTVKLTPTADYKAVSDQLLNAVNQVYAGYKPQIDAQYRQLEVWMDTPVAAPVIESHLQLVEGGLQLWVRYPVELRDAASTDDQITRSMLHLMANDTHVKEAVASAPAITAVVKG